MALSQVLRIIADGGEEAFARLGQREPARTALKQAYTEIGLEGRDIATDGCGRDGKPARCSRKSTEFGAADKGLQICQRFHRIFNGCLKPRKTLGEVMAQAPRCPMSKPKSNINYINNSYFLCVHGFGVIC